MRFSLTFFVAAFSFAQSPFTLDQVMSAPFATSPLPAPTGAKVAWLLNERGQRNIWLADAPDWKARKLTSFNQDDGQEIAELAWAPDTSYLLFARGGDFETGSDNPNPDLSPAKPDQSIWSVSLADGTVKKLAEGHAPAISPKGDIVAFLRAGQIWLMSPTGQSPALAVSQKGSASDLRWSPDGELLAFVSARREHSFIGIFKPADKSLRYLDASVDRDSSPVWSPDGTRLAHTRTAVQNRASAFVPHRSGDPWSIRVFDFKSNTAHQVFRADPGPGSLWHPIAADSQLSWVGQDQIVFPWEKTGWCHLYRLSLSGGSPIELTRGEGEV